MLPESLADALVLYKEHLKTSEPAKKAEEIFNQTQTAVYRYTLPGWGHPAPQGRKPTKNEIAAACKFTQTIPLEKIDNALTAIEYGFNLLEAKSHQRYTYGSRLKAFLTWAKKSDWWKGSKQLKTKNYSPKKSLGYGPRKNTSDRVPLPPYGLKPEKAPISLQLEIEHLRSFFTQPHYPGRNFNPIKPKVVDKHIQAIYRTLGWFAQYKKVAIEDLNFDLIVPTASLKSGKNKKKEQDKAEKAAKDIDIWICAYLNFLEFERKIKSYYTLFSAIVCIQFLIRFQYRDESDRPDYKDVPAMEKIRQHLNKLNKRKTTHIPAIKEELKWLDLPDIFSKIVVPLRRECSFRDSGGNLRPNRAVAHSFQLFLIWGCLTFRPPRRQQEFRDLKIGMTCPIYKPLCLLPNQFIHPMPCDREDDKYHGYLFKDFDSLWYMDITPESYKTGKTYGYQKLVIPNPLFSDGKTFYDYLEAYLYGYYRDSEGNWVSAGHSSTTSIIKGEYISLRMAFNPDHSYVFSQPRKEGSLSLPKFSTIIRNSAHRLTGQSVTPHILRDIYATWFLDQGYTQDRIDSLAYAMAHSPEMLRDIYDRRRPQQKNRPIEETMAAIVQQFVR